MLMRGASLLVLGLLAAACDAQPYRQYATRAEAVEAGEIERGWLPVWLPGSAANLYLQNDLDTNAWWLRTDLTPTAIDSLRSLLVPMSPDSIRVIRPRGSDSWWFEGLVEQQPANDGALNSHLFRGNGDPIPRDVLIAVDRVSPRVYVWTGSFR
jgi:hypothetical protein